MASSCSEQDFYNVLSMLSAAITGTNVVMTNATLQRYETNILFTQMLASIMKCKNLTELVEEISNSQNPTYNHSSSDGSMLLQLSLPAPWRYFRSIAAVTLKNNLQKLRRNNTNIDNHTLQVAANCSLSVLEVIPDEELQRYISMQQTQESFSDIIAELSSLLLVKSAAQVVVIVTKIVGSLKWWSAPTNQGNSSYINNGGGMGDIGTFISTKLLACASSIIGSLGKTAEVGMGVGGAGAIPRPGEYGHAVANAVKITRVQGGLYTLEYLLEDVGHMLAAATGGIIEQVTQICKIADDAQSSKTSTDSSNASVNGGGDFLSVKLPTPSAIRQQTFRFLLSLYERGQELDWNVDNLSEVQLGLRSRSFLFAMAATHICQRHGINSIVQQTGAMGTSVEDENLPVLLMRDVFFAFSTLLDYMEDIYEKGEESGLFVNWVKISVEVLTMACTTEQTRIPVDPEITAAVCNFITKAMTLSLECDGESPIIYVAEAFESYLPKIAPLLFILTIMSPTEEIYALQNDHVDQRDTHSRFSTMKRRYGSSSTTSAEDEERDEEKAVATLRSSASLCLEAVNSYGSQQVFPIIFGHVQRALETFSTTTREDGGWKGGQTHSQADWRETEAAIYVLGTTVVGTYDQLLPYLPSFVPLLIRALNEGKEGNIHQRDPSVLVTSMATWTLMRLTHWILAQEDAVLFDAYLHSLLKCMATTTSKRVQLSTLQALYGLIIAVYQMPQFMPKFAPYVAPIVKFMASLLPRFHSTNLAHLCDAIILLTNNTKIDINGTNNTNESMISTTTTTTIDINNNSQRYNILVSDPSLLHTLYLALLEAFPVKWQRFIETYNRYYSNEGETAPGSSSYTSHGNKSNDSVNNNVVMIEKDVFDIARALYNIVLIKSHRDESDDANSAAFLKDMILSSLHSWGDFLCNVCSRTLSKGDLVFEDAELVMNPFNLCSLLLAGCRTSYIGYPSNKERGDSLSLLTESDSLLHPSLKKLLQTAVVVSYVITTACASDEHDDRGKGLGSEGALSQSNTSIIGTAAQLIGDILRLLPNTVLAEVLNKNMDYSSFIINGGGGEHSGTESGAAQSCCAALTAGTPLVHLIHNFISFWDGVNKGQACANAAEIDLYVVNDLTALIRIVCVSCVVGFEDISRGIARAAPLGDEGNLMQTLQQLLSLLSFVSAHFSHLINHLVRTDGMADTLIMNTNIAIAVTAGVACIIEKYQTVVSINNSHPHILISKIAEQISQNFFAPEKDLLSPQLITKTLFLLSKLTNNGQKVLATKDICSCLHKYFSIPANTSKDIFTQDIVSSLLSMVYSWQMASDAMGVRQDIARAISALVSSSAFAKAAVVGQLEVLNPVYQKSIMDLYSIQ